MERKNQKMVVLDATAGNRDMWKPAKYNPPHTIFLDREFRLKRPPTIFADYRYCPFRDDVFDCVIFDPPFMSRRNPPIYWNDPTASDEYRNWKGFKITNRWWGVNISKIELWSGIHKAQEEFKRISKRVCLKWNELDYNLGKVLVFFKDWKIIHKQGFKK